MKYLAGLILFLVSGAALAQASHGFEFCWTDPTEREDGTPLDPETELAGYELQIVLQGGFESGPLVALYVARADTQPAEATRLAGTDSPGAVRRCYFWQDAVQQGGWYDGRMSAIDTGELTSDWSNVITVRKQ